MQHRLHSMIGYTIHATDGDLGKVHDFYFDDTTWTIRYMVAETGNWLIGRKVLVSLAALGAPDWELETFFVSITCEQVRNSPDIDTEKPVDRQHEVDLHSYYQWPQYWDSGYGGTFGITPFPLLQDPPLVEPAEPVKTEDPHLRSMRHVAGYHIHAIDGVIGHIENFIVNDADWSIRFIIVDTDDWLLDKKVLITPKRIRGVDWATRSIYLDLSKEQVQNSLEFEPWKTIHREFEGNILGVKS